MKHSSPPQSATTTTTTKRPLTYKTRGVLEAMCMDTPIYDMFNAELRPLHPLYLTEEQLTALALKEAAGGAPDAAAPRALLAGDERIRRRVD